MQNQSAFLSKLNPVQRQACKSINGPQLLLAGAGSGKTRVLTFKIAHLIEHHNVDSSQILGVTFTNKAAKEMKERIHQLLPSSHPLPWIGTFHSICLKILKRYSHHIGFTNQFTIYDTSEQKKVIKQILKEQNEPLGINTPSHIKEVISYYKNKNLTPEQAQKRKENQDEKHLREIFIYDCYQKLLLKQNSMDFDDLIFNTETLLKKIPEIQEVYQKYFQYIFIDEFQDTNKSQFDLICLLLNKKKNITVVGDEDQSIYKWRGADIQNILSFQKYFPNSKTIKLEQNYRSSSNILNLANSVIKNNTERLGKKNWTNNSAGDLVELKVCQDETEEANWVAKKILSCQDFKSIAILYRTNAQSRTLEEQLIKNRIPYVILKGTRFYERKEIKDILAYLQILINPQDDNSLKRIINTPKRTIGLKTIEDLTLISQQQSISLYECLQRINEWSFGKATHKINSFVKMIEFFKQKEKETSLSQLIELVITQSGYEEMLQLSKEHDMLSQLDNVKELVASAEDFCNQIENPTLSLYLQELSLFSDNDTISTQETVSLMTVHSSKGLEFNFVFLTGLEEELFPLSSDEIEEERRLFYVATTRAEKKLCLTSTQSRRVWGNTQFKRLSRFIKEIDTQYLEYSDPIESKKNQEFFSFSGLEYDESSYFQDQTYDEFETQAPSFKKGQKVYHQHFGNGKITRVDGTGEMAKVSVDFQGTTKRLVVKFSNLSLVY